MDSEDSQAGGVRLVTVDEELAGQRIDNFLLRELRGVPKSRIYNILRRGEVRVNKARAKPSQRLNGGDIVRIPPVRSRENREAEVDNSLESLIRRSILLEDEALMIINKPSGLAVHGGSGISLGLIEALRQVFPEQRHMELVHRLDRDTSGCIMVAKKRSALKQLHEMLKSKRGVDKRYLALVAGSWPARKQRVDAALEKYQLQSGERMVRAVPGSKRSVTEFQLLQRIPGASLVEARPLTGRWRPCGTTWRPADGCWSAWPGPCPPASWASSWRG